MRDHIVCGSRERTRVGSPWKKCEASAQKKVRASDALTNCRPGEFHDYLRRRGWHLELLWFCCPWSYKCELVLRLASVISRKNSAWWWTAVRRTSVRCLHLSPRIQPDCEYSHSALHSVQTATTLTFSNWLICRLDMRYHLDVQNPILNECTLVLLQRILFRRQVQNTAKQTDILHIIVRIFTGGARTRMLYKCREVTVFQVTALWHENRWQYKTAQTNSSNNISDQSVIFSLSHGVSSNGLPTAPANVSPAVSSTHLFSFHWFIFSCSCVSTGFQSFDSRHLSWPSMQMNCLQLLPWPCGVTRVDILSYEYTWTRRNQGNLISHFDDLHVDLRSNRNGHSVWSSIFCTCSRHFKVNVAIKSIWLGDR